MNLQFLKPRPYKIALFLVFLVILFSALYTQNFIGYWFSAILHTRSVIFFPILWLLNTIGYMLGDGGDYRYIPTYWAVICYSLGLIYSYVLAALLIDPTTRAKWINIAQIIVALFFIAWGFLFIVWQYNPNYNPGDQTLVNFRDIHGWLISAIVLFVAAGILVYRAFRKKPYTSPTVDR